MAEFTIDPRVLNIVIELRLEGKRIEAIRYLRIAHYLTAKEAVVEMEKIESSIRPIIH